jgi:hypothetical protein
MGAAVDATGCLIDSDEDGVAFGLDRDVAIVRRLQCRGEASKVFAGS